MFLILDPSTHRATSSPGQLALQNIWFLVTDNELPAEGMLIGLPGHCHLRVNSQMMLDENRQKLNETDWSEVREPSNSDTVSRLIGARLNQIVSGLETMESSRSAASSSVNFFDSQSDQNPFSNNSFLNPIDTEKIENLILSAEEKITTLLQLDFWNSTLKNYPTLSWNILIYSERLCRRYGLQKWNFGRYCLLQMLSR